MVDPHGCTLCQIVSEFTAFYQISYLFHLLNSIDSNQTILVLIGSIATYSGRRLTVDKLVINPKYDVIYRLNKEKERNALKEVIIDLERNDRRRTQEFDDKHYEYQKVYNSSVDHNTITLLYDIALIKVKNRIIPVFNDSHYIVNSICLPKPLITNERIETLFIGGMGVTDMSWSVTNRLKKGITRMSPTYDECHDLSIMNRIGTQNVTRIICVNGLNRTNHFLFNAGLCSGDSGSPQHQPFGCQAIQIGIESFGDKHPCGYQDGLDQSFRVYAMDSLRDIERQDSKPYKLEKQRKDEGKFEVTCLRI